MSGPEVYCIRKFVTGCVGGGDWRRAWSVVAVAAVMACSACGSGSKNSNGGDGHVPPESVAVVVDDDSDSVEAYPVADNCAGPFRIGATIPDTLAGFVVTESDEYGVLPKGWITGLPVYTYEIGNEGWVKVTPQHDLKSGGTSDKIGGILVYSDLFRTDKGIGAMSLIEDFAVAYPDFTIRYANEEDVFIVETPQLDNVQFFLESECYVGADVHAAPSVSGRLMVSDFKERSCFTAIRIVDSR